MGEFTLQQIGLLIIPVSIIATIAILYLLGHRWQKETTDELKHLRSEFRRYRNEIHQLTVTVQEYDEIEQEPFVSRVATLQDQISTINNQINHLEAKYINFQEQIRSASRNPWKGILGAPAFWYFTRRDITKLDNKLSAQTTHLQTAGETVESLKQLGWEVALRAREARGVDQQVSLLLEKLKSSNVHGDMLDNAVQREKRARDSLTEIPNFFLSADEAAVLEQAEEDSITQAYRILGGTRPELDDLIIQAQAWDKQYNEVIKIVTRMRRVLVDVESSAASAPGKLNLEAFHQRLDGLNIIYQNLHATLSRLEVESIPVVIEEAVHVQENAQEMHAEFKKARQQLIMLESTLSELNDGMKQLSTLFANLGTSQVHPVIWDQSQASIINLSRQVNEIGLINQPRTIDQVDQDLSKSTRLNEERKELAKHCQVIADQHAELSKLLNSPEIRHGREWLQQAQMLAQRVNTYAPENWSRAEAVDSLGEDLGTLEEKMGRLVFADSGESIPENNLLERLEQTRGLAQSYQSLRVRTNSIQKRLVEIQDIENYAREELKAAEAELTQISYLVGSNAYLNNMAARDMERFEYNLGSLINELNTRERDTVEKKAKKIDALASKIDGSTNSWLNQLSKEIQKQTQELSKSITALDEMATIDEKPLSDARQLLSSANMYSGPLSKSATSLSEMIQELKRRSDYWQECAAVSQAVVDIEGPVMESHALASQNRKQVQDEYADLTEWMRQTSSWPPITVELESEELELKSLEMQWNSIKGAPTKAINIVQKLSSLAGKYQMLAERIHQASERVNQEQQQVEEVEIELDEYVRLWQDQWRANRNSHQADQEINELLSDTERELNEIKNDYRHEKKDYDDTLQALKLLHRRVRLAQVAVDDTHVIDMNGRSIAYRE